MVASTVVLGESSVPHVRVLVRLDELFLCNPQCMITTASALFIGKTGLLHRHVALMRS